MWTKAKKKGRKENLNNLERTGSSDLVMRNHAVGVTCLVPVRIVEYLPDLEALGRLGEADHVVGGADLDEGEPGHLGQSGGKGRLAGIWSSLQKDARYMYINIE